MKAQVISMANRGGSTITSVSYDDMVRFIDQSSGTFVGEPLKCPSQPQKIVALKSSPDLAVIGCLKHIVVVNGYDIAHTMELNHGVVKLALASDGSKVACSCTDKKVRIYSMTSSLGLDLEKEIPFNADPTNLEFSPDGSFLAVIDSSRVIKVFEVRFDKHNFEFVIVQYERMRKRAWQTACTKELSPPQKSKKLIGGRKIFITPSNCNCSFTW